MPQFFLPLDGRKAVYKQCTPDALMSIGTGSNSLERHWALTALFEQHTPEAIRYQQRLLHYWAQHPCDYMPDEPVIIKALTYYLPHEQTAGHFILARRKTQNELTFSDEEFKKHFDKLHIPELQDGLIAASFLVRNAMMLTVGQHRKLLFQLKAKYTPNTATMLSTFAPYMTEGELEEAIDFLIDNVSDECLGFSLQPIQILGSYLPKPIQFKESRARILEFILSASAYSWNQRISYLCSVISIARTENFIFDFLKELQKQPIRNYSDAHPLLNKCIPFLNQNKIKEYLNPMLTEIFDDDNNERVQEFLIVIIQYMTPQQLQPILDQILSNLQHFMPSNYSECDIEVQLLYAAAANATAEQLQPAYELFCSILSKTDLTLRQDLRIFSPFIMKLGCKLLTDVQLNAIIKEAFESALHDERNIKKFNELLSCLPKAQRSLAITDLLRNTIFNLKVNFYSAEYYQKTMEAVACYTTSEHQMMLLELKPYTRRLLEVWPFFHSILSPQLIKQLLDTIFNSLDKGFYLVLEEIYAALELINYKTSVAQKIQIYDALDTHMNTYNELPYGKIREKNVVVLTGLFPFLPEERRKSCLEHIYSRARSLQELLGLFYQIRCDIPKVCINDILCKILEYIKNDKKHIWLSSVHDSKWLEQIFLILGSQIEKEQQNQLIDTILECCAKTQPSNTDDKHEHEVYRATRLIAESACEMIPSLINNLNSEERLALFNRLNMSEVSRYLSAVILFPDFLNRSDPKNPGIENVGQLEQEHSCYINYLVSIINAPERLQPRANYRPATQQALTALNTWLLQGYKECPQYIDSLNKVIQKAKREENTEEFYTLQQLVRLYCVSTNSVENILNYAQ